MTALGEGQERDENSVETIRKRLSGVSYGASCKTSLDSIVKCDVDLVTSFHIVVSNK